MRQEPSNYRFEMREATRERLEALREQDELLKLAEREHEDDFFDMPIQT